MNIKTLYHEPHVYAYSVAAKPGWLKIGYTDKQTVQERIDQDLKTPNIAYAIEMDEVSSVRGGMFFRDSDVHKILEAKNFLREYRVEKDKKTGLPKKKATEWFKCGVEDVRAIVHALQNREDPKTATKKNTFGMRDEQRQAVRQTKEYFDTHRRTAGGQPPSYLWNAKMRFGKTFATYKLMEAMKWKKVLVLTFKPAVEDSWQSDLEGHKDFEGWQFVSKSEGALDWEDADKSRPVVWFGSFQDFLQLDKRTGEYKARNQVAFDVEWDCVVVDEYHFGAWRNDNREFTGSIEDDETRAELGGEDAEEFDIEKSPLKAKHYLMLSGTPFRAIKNGEFGEDQVFNWTYSDEQKAKAEWAAAHPGEENPYAMLPKMNMLVYRLPDKIARVAEKQDVGFDLNEFFRAERKGGKARFVHENEVSKWLDFMRGEFFFDGAKPVLPFYDVEMKRALRHTVWYLPGVASCEAMYALLNDAAHKGYYGQYEVICCAGSHAGVGRDALESVRPYVIADPLGMTTKGRSITLTCGKLTTGVTVPAWTAILMLRSMKSPESYFQAAFRVQSPWTMRNADGKSPNDVTILKENCYILDFALNRALAQIADYSANLSDKQSVPVENVKAFINFMPVICYDGSKMAAVDAGEVLELAYTGISGSAMARRWNSNDLLNITPSVLDSIKNDEMALAAIGKIEGFANPRGEIKAFVNQTKKVNSLKKKAREGDRKAKKELTEEEKKLRKQRSEIEKKLKKFATRIPIFMYLSDYREEALVDVIRNLEPALFTQVTGLSIRDFELLIDKGVFNSATMNSCIWQFRAYEEESLDYLHLRLDGPKDTDRVGGFNSSVSRKEAYESLKG